MTAYDVQITMADRMLSSRGAVATVQRMTPGAYDPSTGTAGAPVSATASAMGVIIPAGRTAELRVGSLIGRRIQDVLLSPLTTAGAPLPFRPEPGDTIAVGALTLTILAVTTIEPDGNPVLHQCHCER